MASRASSAWRSNRGEPQARQRPDCGGRRRDSRGRSGAHGNVWCSHVRPSAVRARATRPGRSRRFVGKRDQETLVAEHMLEHPGEKAGLAGRCANLGRPIPVEERKRVKPLRLLGNEGKRLNRQHFRRFARWSQGRFMALHLPFRNKSELASRQPSARR